MSELVEVLFTCDADDQNQLSIAAWDLRNGTNLMNYKGGGCVSPRSLCFLRTEYVFTANSTKPLLHVWPINGQEQINSVRFVVPGRVTAMAMSPDGLFLVAGIQESIYIWQLLTGRMLNTISKHYQSITCVRFTEDSAYFVTAGKDGAVLVWNLTQAISRGDNNQLPLYSFNDHGLPVTDVHIGTGGTRAYMFTVSLDRSCKVYDLSNGSLLLSVVFTESLHSVAVNTLETSVYVGTGEGNIYVFHIDAVPRVKEYHMEKDAFEKFVGHKSGTAVNCLALSLDGHTLVSGGQDQQVCLWHIGSHQLIKAMPHKGTINDIFLRLTNPAIFHPQHKQPKRFAANLRRMIDPPETFEDEVMEVLVTQPILSLEPNEIYASQLKPTVLAKGNTEECTSADNDEAKKLRNEVENLKRINKELFQVSSRLLLNKSKKK